MQSGRVSIEDLDLLFAEQDRKSILRVLKPHLDKLCKDGEAQTVLFTAFDVVDDTKMMGKAIISVSNLDLPLRLYLTAFYL
jgi:pumilio family protein 6